MYRICGECFQNDYSEIEGSHVPVCRRCQSHNLIVMSIETYREYMKLHDRYMQRTAQITAKWRDDLEAVKSEFKREWMIIVREGPNHEISV